MMSLEYNSDRFHIWANKPGENFTPVLVDYSDTNLSFALPNEEAWDVINGARAVPVEHRDEWIAAYVTFVHMEKVNEDRLRK
jgi:hypothetical protein